MIANVSANTTSLPMAFPVIPPLPVDPVVIGVILVVALIIIAMNFKEMIKLAVAIVIGIIIIYATLLYMKKI